MWIAQDDLEDFFPDDEVCDLGSSHRRSVDSAGPRVAVVQLGNGLRQLRLVAAHFVIRQVCWRLDDAMAVADTRRSSEIRRHVFVVHVDCLEYAYAELAEEEGGLGVYDFLLVKPELQSGVADVAEPVPRLGRNVSSYLLDQRRALV